MRPFANSRQRHSTPNQAPSNAKDQSSSPRMSSLNRYPTSQSSWFMGVEPITELLRREDHHHAATLHRRVLLELGHFFQLLDEPVDEFVAFVDVRVLAAAEDDREDHLVLVRQELFRPVDLGHQVVVADFRAEPQLFVFAVMSVTFVLPLLLLVLELAEVHD